MDIEPSSDVELWHGSPVRAGWRSCEICDHEGLDVLPWLGRYPTADGTMVFATVTRCKDAVACRARCEAAGNQWPLA